MVFVIGMGILSAFLVNDTIALLAIPLVIYISQRTGIKPAVLLIALSFGITVGSTMTPIGNPQNLLIAIQGGISLPFTAFLRMLGIPTMINLIVTYFILKFYYRKELFLSVKLPKTGFTENNINNDNDDDIDKADPINAVVQIKPTVKDLGLLQCIYYHTNMIYLII